MLTPIGKGFVDDRRRIAIAVAIGAGLGNLWLFPGVHPDWSRWALAIVAGAALFQLAGRDVRTFGLVLPVERSRSYWWRIGVVL